MIRRRRRTRGNARRGGTYAGTEGEVAAQAHACAANAAVTVRVGEEVINGLGDILVVGVECLQKIAPC